MSTGIFFPPLRRRVKGMSFCQKSKMVIFSVSCTSTGTCNGRYKSKITEKNQQVNKNTGTVTGYQYEKRERFSMLPFRDHFLNIFRGFLSSALKKPVFWMCRSWVTTRSALTTHSPSCPARPSTSRSSTKMRQTNSTSLFCSKLAYFAVKKNMFIIEILPFQLLI